MIGNQTSPDPKNPKLPASKPPPKRKANPFAKKKLLQAAPEEIESVTQPRADNLEEGREKEKEKEMEKEKEKETVDEMVVEKSVAPSVKSIDSEGNFDSKEATNSDRHNKSYANSNATAVATAAEIQKPKQMTLNSFFKKAAITRTDSTAKFQRSVFEIDADQEKMEVSFLSPPPPFSLFSFLSQFMFPFSDAFF